MINIPYFKIRSPTNHIASFTGFFQGLWQRRQPIRPGKEDDYTLIIIWIVNPDTLNPDYYMNSDIEYFFVYKVTYKLTTI